VPKFDKGNGRGERGDGKGGPRPSGIVKRGWTGLKVYRGVGFKGATKGMERRGDRRIRRKQDRAGERGQGDWAKEGVENKN